MIFGYMNYVRHPDNPAWRVFVYRSQEVGQLVADKVQAAGIWCSLEPAPNDNEVWMLVIEKKDFDAVFAHNAAVMNHHRPPLIPDSFLRKLLIGVLFFGTGLAITGAIVTRFKENAQKDSLTNESSTGTEDILTATSYSALELQMKALGWIGVRSLDSTIQVSLRYSQPTNFTGEVLYPELSDAYLHPEAANQLIEAHSNLKRKHPGLHFLLYDAGRPRSVQVQLHAHLLKMGLGGTEYVSSPKKGSVHNFGMAVDLTLADSLGNPLDMGTEYDYFGPLAHPELEDSLLSSGKLTAQQVQNRRILRRVMREAGFSTIASEWWHFNLYSRDRIPAGVPMLE